MSYLPIVLTVFYLTELRLCCTNVHDASSFLSTVATVCISTCLYGASMKLISRIA